MRQPPDWLWIRDRPARPPPSRPTPREPCCSIWPAANGPRTGSGPSGSAPTSCQRHALARARAPGRCGSPNPPDTWACDPASPVAIGDADNVASLLDATRPAARARRAACWVPRGGLLDRREHRAASSIVSAAAELRISILGHSRSRDGGAHFNLFRSVEAEPTRWPRRRPSGDARMGAADARRQLGRARTTAPPAPGERTPRSSCPTWPASAGTTAARVAPGPT